MPTVPTLNPAPQVQDQALPNVRQGADPSLEAFGGGQSLDQVNQANIHTQDKVQGVLFEIKRKADDAFSQDAYAKIVQAKNDLLYNPQTGAMTRHGQAAFGVPDEYGKKFQDVANDLVKSANNADQSAMIQRIVAQQGADFHDSLQKHVFVESQKFAEQTNQSAIAASQDDAVQNYTKPGAVDQNIALQSSLIQTRAQQTGVPADVVKLQLQEAASKTYAGVIDRMLANGDDKTARDYYFGNDSTPGIKDKVDGKTAIVLEKALDRSDTATLGNQAWDQMQGMKLSDGTPDIGRMESTIRSNADLSDAKKEKIVDYVKGRAGEQIVNQNRQDQARDRSFMNDVTGMRKDGVPIDDALKLVDKYSKDDYDASLKTAQIQSVYAPPKDSDHAVFLATWEKVQNGTATREDIDNQFKSGLLNASDHTKLWEEQYNSKINGVGAAYKEAWDRVKILGEDKFPGNNKKEDRDKFLYVMHVQAAGKAPDEIWKMANDKLKEVPTGDKNWLGFDKHDTGWKIDLNRIDANNLGWGKLNSEVGQTQVSAIGDAIRRTKPQWSIADVSAYADSMGGYDSIKAGTPANNAIQSLVAKKQPATPANVKAVLSKFPDGKF